MKRDLDVNELSNQQKDALRAIVRWHREETLNNQVFVFPDLRAPARPS